MADRKAVIRLVTFELLSIAFRPPLEIEVGGFILKAPLRERGNLWKGLGDELRPFIRALFAIEGISMVTVEAYEIKIFKATLYDWGELRPRIHEALGATLTE